MTTINKFMDGILTKYINSN